VAPVGGMIRSLGSAHKCGAKTQRIKKPKAIRRMLPLSRVYLKKCLMILQVALENGKGLGGWEIGDLEIAACKLQNFKLD